MNDPAVNTNKKIKGYSCYVLDDLDDNQDEEETDINNSKIDILELMETYETMYQEKIDAEKGLKETR